MRQITLLEVVVDPVIYSVSPLKAYTGGLFLIALLFVLGSFGVLSAFLSRQRRKKIIERIITGVLGAFLILCGAVLGFVMSREYKTGQRTVLVQVNEKREVESNCPDGGICRSYTAETTDGQKLYVFGLKKEVWEKIEVDACYEFTYFPSQSLLGEYLQEDDSYPNLYEPTGEITQIELFNCP